MFLNEACDLMCEIAFVEGISAVSGDAFECVSEAWVTKDIACLRGFTIDQEGIGETRLIAKNGFTAFPCRGDDFGDREAIACVLDGRLHESFEGKFSEAGMELEPAVDAAWNGDWQDAERWDAFELSFVEFFESESCGGATARIEPMGTLGFAIPDDCEKIPADAAAGGFGESEHGICGDSGIDSGATFFENIKGGESGEWLAGGCHSISGDHF